MDHSKGRFDKIPKIKMNNNETKININSFP